MLKLIEYIEKLDNDKMLLFMGQNTDSEAYVKPPVFLFTHSLNRTGAPCALLDMAEVLVDNDSNVFMVSANDGELRNDVINTGVNLIIYPYYDQDGDFLGKIVMMSDFILVNTLLLYSLVQSFAPVTRRLFWWLHEVEDTFQIMQKVYTDIPKIATLKILAASPQIHGFVNKYMRRESQVLNCFVNDNKAVENTSDSSKIKFIQVGLIIGIKGQQVLSKAISLLPEEISEKCEFIFCGDFATAEADLLSELRSLEEKKANVRLINTLPREELFKLYDETAAVIVPSYQESTSLIAVEGLMKEKVCICSDGCGICDYLTDGENAFIFKAGNAEQLAEKIIYTVENYKSLEQLRKSGRKVYENNYSREIFEKNLLAIVENKK